MKYAINWTRDFRHLHEVDEVILNYYSGSENVVSFVTDNFTDYKSQRIIINLLELEEAEINKVVTYINKLRKDGFNIAAIITSTDFNINIMKENNIPFFFNKHAYNLDTAAALAEAGASDIYVVEELGFRLKDIQYIREKYGVQIRVFPNITQSANNKYINGMERFWIRPEDTEIYEPYVDVFEILPGQKDTSRLSVVYEIYRDRQWLGNLNDIILDFKSPIVNNRGMDPHFAENRLNCGKKCLIGKCNLCTQIGDLANMFTEVGLEVVKKKYKPERTKEEIEEELNKLKERARELEINQDSNDSEPEETV